MFWGGRERTRMGNKMNGIERIVELKEKQPESIEAEILFKLPVACVEVRRRRGAVVAFSELNTNKSDDNGYYVKPAGANYVRWPDVERKRYTINYGEPAWYATIARVLESTNL